jgi:methane/ammonia monooxygenase subunit A
MAATAAAVSAAEAERQELRAVLHKQYRWLDYKFDIVFWITAAFVVGAAADITKLLFAGDWDFWTDWKDRQWWPIISPFAFIIIPSALQYIQWLAWRFPTGATYTAVCMFASSSGRALLPIRWCSSGRRRSFRLAFSSTGSCSRPRASS